MLSPKKTIILFYLIQSVHSTPLDVSTKPSVAHLDRTDAKRAPDPKASDYPWADSNDPLIENEFKWLGWNKDDDKDKEDGQKIHKAFREWHDFAKAGEKAAVAKGDIYKRWFETNGVEQDKPEDVPNVFKSMFTSGTGVASPNMAKMVNRRDDFNPDPEARCDKHPRMRAYTVPERGEFHYCPYGIDSPPNAELKCENFDDSVSAKMRSMTMTFLHELTHYDKFGADQINEAIEDQKNGRGAYDCFKLATDEKVANAQNYAWLAADSYWGEQCKKTFKDPLIGVQNTDDPEDDPSSDIKLSCTRVKFDTNNAYIFRDTLSDVINNTYCPKFEGMASNIGLGHYLDYTPEAVEIGAIGGHSAAPPSVEGCKQHLTELLDSCDVAANGNNPMDWKAGGELELEGWTYSLKLLYDRPPAPTRPKAWCQKDSCDNSGCTMRVWGAGWEGSNFGQALRKSLDDFTFVNRNADGEKGYWYDTTGWEDNFVYEFMDGHEWYVVFRQGKGVTTGWQLGTVANDLDANTC